MKRIFLGFAITLVCSSLALASIKSGADKLINEVSPDTNIGIEVIDLSTGTLIYQRNPLRSYIPASNMKLFSDAAALMVLGPDYRFKNQLSTNASQLEQGILKGSLFLQLSGDPSFNRERLAALLGALKSWHIQRIQGNVIIDSSHAGVDPYAPGWMASDRAYGYGAPVAPVMIDANRMIATANPADTPGTSAIIEVSDEGGSVHITNLVQTKASGAHCGIDFAMDNDNHLTVRGCIGVGQTAVQQEIAIRNPLMYAQGLIRQQLNQINIVLDGQVLLGKTPSGSMLIAKESSKPIAQLMADTLKPSDNLYADSLFLHAADKLHGSPLNWPEAQPVIKAFLQQQTGIDFQKSVLIDGSGLSRYDLLTAEQTVNLLRFLSERFPLAYEYIAALPVSGRDGTLQKRFKKPNQQDMIRAKTGTMTGVMSLSGYLSTANAHTLAFAIFINNPPGTKLSVSGRYRYLVDALCNYFLKQKPGSNAWSRAFSSAAPRIKYQLSPTQAEQQRGRQARWRRLEIMVKQALKGQTVTVIYRGNELILQDNQMDASRVMSALQNVRKKYPFAVAVASKTMPMLSFKPQILWTEASIMPSNLQRVWTIREAV